MAADMQDLVARFAGLGIEAGFHPGITGRGRVWLVVGRVAGVDFSGQPLESDHRKSCRTRWSWAIADAQHLLELIEAATARPWRTYEERVRAMEAASATRSDAQAIVDAEDLQGTLL